MHEDKRASHSRGISILIPVYNESDSIDSLLDELEFVMSQISRPYEVLLIDDGSLDNTWQVLQRHGLSWPESRVIRFATNHGQAAALYYGIQHAIAPVVIVMDGDGQNDPRDIPALLDRLQDSGADMVMGVRARRLDSLLRRCMSRLANRVRSCFLHDGVQDAGCGLKAFKREVGDAFIPLRTLYSFMPALAVGAGFKVVELPVNHRARTKGESKYGLGVMFWRPVVDMIGIWWFLQRRCAIQVPLVQLVQTTGKSQAEDEQP